jgi:hypothetical protein
MIKLLIINFRPMDSMKAIHSKLLILAFLTQTIGCAAQQPVKDSIVGTWKGTSLCQVKSSPCHDENAIYHISKAANGKTYTMQMNKIVNGVEEEMGASEGIYDESKHTLTTTTEDRQGRVGVWLFKIDGKQMHGTLTIDEKILYRVIEVKKAD